MSNTSRPIFAMIHAGIRSGKLTTGFAAFATIGIVAGAGWTENRSAELAERDDCIPVVWQEEWTGTERADAWQMLIDQGWELRDGTHADLLLPPDCESAPPTDTQED